MKMVFRNSKFAIFDDVLPPEIFEKVWLHVQLENYATPLQSGAWVKVWRFGDSFPFGSAEYLLSKRPFNNYMDVMGHFFTEIARTCADMVGEEGVWTDIAMRSYLYPRGSKLSWHNDAMAYAGALTYYIHPKWGSTWGGELMVAEVPPLADLKKKPLVGPHLEHEWEDDYINEQGVGQWISPKPNRCVIMPGGVYHSVNRIDQNAGDFPRASIVGFLLKPQNVIQEQRDRKAADMEDRIDLEIKTIGEL